jgi:hypothetical protein
MQNILDDMERAIDDGVNCVKARAPVAHSRALDCFV